MQITRTTGQDCLIRSHNKYLLNNYALPLKWQRLFIIKYIFTLFSLFCILKANMLFDGIAIGEKLLQNSLQLLLSGCYYYGFFTGTESVLVKQQSLL